MIQGWLCVIRDPMNKIIPIALLLILAAQSSCVLHSFQETPPEPVAPVEGYATLNKLPFREAWYGMYFQEDKIGYSHFKIEPSGDVFDITSESLMRLKANNKTREIGLKEKVKVKPDLTMISF